MRFSVVVPVRNDRRLSRCLEGLAGQTVGSDAYEVLVIDDGRSNDTPRLVSNYPAHYSAGSGGGAYAARNQGIAESTGNILVFTDADCHPPPQWLAIIGSVLERERCEAVVGPSYALNDDPVGLLVQTVDQARWDRLATEQRVNFCDTRNLAGRRALFLQEPFDASFRRAGDLEWGIRVSKRGYRILCVPEMAVGHENVTSLPKVWRRGVLRGRGLARVRDKHGRGVRISGSRSFRMFGLDLKERFLVTVSYPTLRPIISAGLAVATASLAAFVWLLLQVPRLRRWARRPFELLDRASLLLGLVLGR